MDAVGSPRAAIMGVSEGGPMTLLFAATYPERTAAAILYGTGAGHAPQAAVTQHRERPGRPRVVAQVGADEREPERGPGPHSHEPRRRCAPRPSRHHGAAELGLQVRAGLHTGECEVVDGKVGGIAVHIGARVAAQAAPGEVLVSSTVKELVAGSGIQFQPGGTATLKGLPDEWQLYAVAQPVSVR